VSAGEPSGLRGTLACSGDIDPVACHRERGGGFMTLTVGKVTQIRLTCRPLP
jgi:hypothetical protein